MFLVLCALSISRARATESCSVDVSPTSVQGNTETAFTFALTNTGASTINWIKIIRPSSNFSLVNYGVSGWSISANQEFAELSGGEVLSGAPLSFNYTARIGGSEAPSANWGVSTNTGSGEVACTGSMSTAITGVADVSPPVMSETITVSDVTATAVKVGWTTNESATSVVYYGPTQDYGFTKTGSSGTEHQVTVDGLSANTTYYFYVESADSAGNTTSSDEGSFVTASAGSTGQTVTVTNTVTTTTTQTVTKIVTDTTPPVVKIDELEKRVWESAPLITGSASDDRGVAKVEYRIKEREVSWSNASLDPPSPGLRRGKWEFLPPISLDGTYVVEIRGVDVFGNVSVPKSVEFVIDQLPPTVGGGVISLGALPLSAEGGMVRVMEGVEYEVVLYEAGGADQVNLEIQNHKFQIQKMGTQGLWRGLVKFEEAGEFVSKVRAIDGALNETEREWVKFQVIPRGRVEAEKIRVYWLDPTIKQYQLWDGEEYGQQGVQVVGADQRFGWVLPSGEYYLEAESQGNKIISQKISLAKTTTISRDWEVGEPKWWEKLLKIRRLANLAVTQSHSDTVTRQLGVGRDKWIGKKSVVYLGTGELPWYSETRRRAQEWADHEGAQVVELSVQGSDDPKGEWLKKLKIGLLPQVYLVNDKGDTMDYKEGIWER